MKLSVVSSVFGGMSLDEALKFLSSEGVPQLELGVGGYPGTALADAKMSCAVEQPERTIYSAKSRKRLSPVTLYTPTTAPSIELAANPP